MSKLIAALVAGMFVFGTSAFAADAKKEEAKKEAKKDEKKEEKKGH